MTPRRYSVGLLLDRRSAPVPAVGPEVRRRVEVFAESPQGARDVARRAYPGWHPYAPRPV